MSNENKVVGVADALQKCHDWEAMIGRVRNTVQSKTQHGGLGKGSTLLKESTGEEALPESVANAVDPPLSDVIGELDEYTVDPTASSFKIRADGASVREFKISEKRGRIVNTQVSECFHHAGSCGKLA